MKTFQFIFVTIAVFTFSFSAAQPKSISDSLSHLAYSKSNLDTALFYFNKAEQVIENDTQRGVYYFYKSFFFLKNKYYENYEKIEDLAFKYLIKSKQLDKLDWIYSTTYWIYVGESQYEKAMALTLKVEKITRELKDTTHHIITLIKLANIYHDLANYSSGIQTALKAMNEAKQLNNNDLISRATVGLAMNFDDWGKYDSAIYYYYTILNLSEYHDYGQLYNNLGNTYIKMNNLDSALKYVTLAYNLDMGKDDPYNLSTYINNLGHIYLKKKQYDKAKFYFDSAYYYARLSENHEKLRDVNYTLYLYNNEVKNYPTALKHLADYHAYKDSILDVKRLSIIENLEGKAKEAEYQNQLLVMENEAKARNFWIALFAALLLIALLIIRQVYLKRQRVAKEAELNLQKERLRISRDLHDNIGAELTFISSYIDQHTFSLKDEFAKKELEKISESSRMAMAQMRETIWAIQNEKIDVEKLVGKLQQILGKYAGVHHIDVKITQSGENYELKPALIISLIRVCQEAVTNAIKYAHCKQINIEINAEENKLYTNIHDNGLGFDIQRIQKGNGLNNMKERVEELGGVFDIHSFADKGTHIQFQIPLQI